MFSEVLTGAPRDPDLAAFLVRAVADPGRLVLGVDHHHVAHVDGRLLRDDPALLGAALGRADGGVLLHAPHALDQDALDLRVGGDDATLRTLVLAGQDDDGVTLLDLHRRRPLVVSHGSQHLRSERDDPHEALVAELPADRAEDARTARVAAVARSEEHTSELQSRQYLVCRLLLEKKKNNCRVNTQPQCTQALAIHSVATS